MDSLEPKYSLATKRQAMGFVSSLIPTADGGDGRRDCPRAVEGLEHWGVVVILLIRSLVWGKQPWNCLDFTFLDTYLINPNFTVLPCISLSMKLI